MTTAGVPVAIGFNRRFDPGFAEARGRVQRGEIGRLEQLSIVSRDPAPPTPDYLAVSGGLFRDMTIHDFDMARFFVDDIVEVHATGTTIFDRGAKDHGDYDTAVTVLRSASGTIVTIINSRHSAVGYDQRMEAFGESGVIHVGNAPTSLVSISSADAVEARSPYQPFFLQRYAQAYAHELREFVALARGEESAAPTYDDGRAALILAGAARRSATTKRAVAVDLDV